MTAKTISDLFASDIDRRIEEVIKVDQADETIIHDELAEYVVTDSIRAHFTKILDRYRRPPEKPHEGIGVWVSGLLRLRQVELRQVPRPGPGESEASSARVRGNSSPNAPGTRRSRSC